MTCTAQNLKPGDTIHSPADCGPVTVLSVEPHECGDSLVVIHTDGQPWGRLVTGSATRFQVPRGA